MIEELMKEERCKCCGSLLRRAYVRLICDNCGKVIEEGEAVSPEFELTVFKHRIDEAEEKHFCSWKCVREWLLKFDGDFDFITLPYLHKESLEAFKKEFLRRDKR